MIFNDTDIADQADKVITLLAEMLGKDSQSVQILANILWRFRFDMAIRNNNDWSNVDVDYMSAIRYENKILNATQQ